MTWGLGLEGEVLGQMVVITAFHPGLLSTSTGLGPNGPVTGILSRCDLPIIMTRLQLGGWSKHNLSQDNSQRGLHSAVQGCGIAEDSPAGCPRGDFVIQVIESSRV